MSCGPFTSAVNDYIANCLLASFGAVTEEFEVRDAIENTLVTKSVHWSFLVR